MSSASRPSGLPTTVRYVVLALTTMVAVLLYLDRICLSFAERYVKEDLGISNEQMSLVLSAFFWAYAFGQLPAGWLSDRFGARLMLALYLAVWSAFTGLLGFAYGLGTLVMLRLGCGLFEAGAYPAAAGIIGKWMPLNRRGLASGIVSVGGRLGGAAAPILTAYLMVAFVPLSSSSLLGPDDVMQMGPLFKAMKYSLSAPQDPHVFLTFKIVGGLPADMQTVYYADRPLIREPTQAFRAQVAETLNGLIKRPDLLDGIDLKELDLPAEAKRLLQPSPVPRTQEEIERRNRLVLEAAFPDAIRKIYGSGWRPVMMMYGIAGIIVAGIFFWLFRDSPRQHPGCNPAEIALIEGDSGAFDPRAAPEPLPFTCMLTSVGLWLSSAIQFLTNFGWAFLITWFPRYLKDVHNVPLVERGWMTSLPIFVGMAGMFGGGWLTDYMAMRVGRRWGRAAPLALTRFVVSGAFLMCLFLQSPWQVTVAMAMVALATDLGTPSVWAYSLDVGGKHVGSVLGWSNMFGNLGAALSPIILNWILVQRGPDEMFVACAAALALAGVLALFLDATKPVVPEPRPPLAGSC